MLHLSHIFVMDRTGGKDKLHSGQLNEIFNSYL